MLLITCPACSITADETEFACGGPYSPENRIYGRGLMQEWWLCEAGCGTWFGMTRHAGNQRIVATWLTSDETSMREDVP